MAKFKTYSISSDTLNATLDSPALHEAMILDSTVGNVFDGINRQQGSDSFDCYLSVDRTTDLDNAMDTIVGNHTGNPLPEAVQIVKSHLGTDNIKLLEFGYNFVATNNSTTDNDKALPVKYMRGCWFEAIDHVFGDSITVQIVDKDNVLGAGSDYVVSEFGNDVQIPISGVFEVMSESRTGEIPSGLYIRVKYKSAGTTTDVKCKMNCTGYNDA